MSEEQSEETPAEMAQQSYIATADYDYELPSELIAQRPLTDRASRLLVLPSSGELRHQNFEDLTELLLPGDLLVYNETRVVKARLFGHKLLDANQQASASSSSELGARAELLLIEPLERGGGTRWRAMLRPARRFRSGGRLRLVRPSGEQSTESEGDPVDLGIAPDQNTHQPDAGPRDVFFEVRFPQPVADVLERFGSVPLPPYIERASDARDIDDYQTVFARVPGAVAAPTAGLHFTPPLLEKLRQRGVKRRGVTLHVGPGTFRPIAGDNALEHPMHSEWYDVPDATVQAIAETRAAGGRVVAVGTTTVRTLEAAARRVSESSASAEASQLLPASGAARTNLYITPGFRFRVVDVLITNFHLPRSTLLLLVSAFSGRERILAAYKAAIRERYRFFSYGDAMLLERS